MPDSRFVEDGRPHRERMLAGDQYIASDPDLVREANRAARLCAEFNTTAGDDWDGRLAILRDLLGTLGDSVVLQPPFRCDYGYQLHVGDGVFANWNLTVIDVAPVRIGASTKIGPNVSLYTATHPIEPAPRRAGWEGSRPITIGDNVWLGGGVTVCPGVTVGDNAVVGAGSVVIRDLPANVVAVGNPARIVRALTP